MTCKHIIGVCLSTAMLFGALSCSDSSDPILQEEEQVDSHISFTPNLLEVPSDGGIYTVSYQVSHPIPDAVAFANTEGDWIDKISVMNDQIELVIDPNNEQTERQTMVSLKYPGVYPDAEFAVRQAGFLLPVIHLAAQNIDMPSEGGKGQMQFTIDNPIENVGLQFDCSEAWVHDLRTNDNVIYFEVDRNPKVVERQAQISVSYERAQKSCTFTISQAAGEAEKPEILRIEACGVGFEVVGVKGGTFMMGATEDQQPEANEDEYPVHSVTLSDYYIGRCEVTQELWVAVMGENPSYWEVGNLQLPVEQVSWNKIQEFLSKLSQITGRKFSLPTEAQWEFAARGGNNSLGYKYSGSNDLEQIAWYADNSDKHTHDVGTKKANELGIYDMCGNVQEWCYDFYGTYSAEAQTDPQGPSDGTYKVLRGASFIYFPEGCRVACRAGSSATGGDSSYGFRVAMSK